MRTSVTLDDQIYELASLYASARGITLGAAIGELIRRGEGASGSATASPSLRSSANGFPLFPRRGTPITSQMVKDAQEDAVV